jgi:hypothetical protein
MGHGHDPFEARVLPHVGGDVSILVEMEAPARLPLGYSSPQDRRRALDAAVEGLYRAFADELHGPVCGCPHCTSPADDQQLGAKPLRQLTGNDLGRFAYKAVTTLGTVQDLKHFLPRLLEIAAHEGAVGGTDFEIMMGKLSYARWTDWTHAHRVAIGEYLIAMWRHMLSVFPSSLDADACLCGIGQVVDDLAPFLNAWRLDASVPAVRHLADFIGSNLQTLLKHHRLGNAFWQERSGPMRQALDWLLQPDTCSQLEEAFFRSTADPIADELSQAVEQLGWVHKALGTV